MSELIENPDYLAPSELAILRKAVATAIKEKADNPKARPIILEPESVKQIVDNLVVASQRGKARSQIAAAKILGELVKANAIDLTATAKGLDSINNCLGGTKSQDYSNQQSVNVGVKVEVPAAITQEQREALKLELQRQISIEKARQGLIDENKNGQQ